jgi:hypothetical protein
MVFTAYRFCFRSSITNMTAMTSIAKSINIVIAILFNESIGIAIAITFATSIVIAILQ